MEKCLIYNQPTLTYNNILKIQRLNNLPFKSELKSKVKIRQKERKQTAATKIQKGFRDFLRRRREQAEQAEQDERAQMLLQTKKRSVPAELRKRLVRE